MTAKQYIGFLALIMPAFDGGEVGQRVGGRDGENVRKNEREIR